MITKCSSKFSRSPLLNTSHPEILNVFQNSLNFRETQLDKKILSGLLKGTGMEIKHQLYLSMVWDRIDIAEEKIFVHSK